MSDKRQTDNAYEFAAELCRAADKDKAFLDRFWPELCGEEDLLEEFCYYAENRKFACKASESGYTVVDVMVWQIDHFKAQLDRGNTGMRDNGSMMILMAFDTFLKMRKEPGRYIRMIQQETGTDYPDKY